MNPENLNKIIGINIKKYRIINNIKLKELSKLTGISLITLINIERNTINREITIQELYKISIVLNITVNKLLENNYDQ